MVLQWQVVLTIFLAAAFGLVVGAIPGLTATMPSRFWSPSPSHGPHPGGGAMISCSAMAIFAGDIPSTLMRMPGTPASAAYTDECYAMTRKGQRSWRWAPMFPVLGAGRPVRHHLILIVSAPLLAEVALQFSSYEYFWLALLGLACASHWHRFAAEGAHLALSRPVRRLYRVGESGGHSALHAGQHRSHERGDFIPAMIGLFAVSEVIRTMVSGAKDWT